MQSDALTTWQVVGEPFGALGLAALVLCSGCAQATGGVREPPHLGHGLMTRDASVPENVAPRLRMASETQGAGPVAQPTEGHDADAKAGAGAGTIPPTETVGFDAAALCPDQMALLRRPQGAYCIDRYEASLALRKSDGSLEPWPGNHRVDGHEDDILAVCESGRMPQGYIDGVQAGRACENAGKRLCELDEWVRACRGPKRQQYPYGDLRRPNVCNDRYQRLDHHPVVTLFKRYAEAGTPEVLMWHPTWMNDPRLHELSHSVAPTGQFADCRNEYGVFDMVGNLHEWVADDAGTFAGGFFMDTFQNGEGCEYRTTAHPIEYQDYSTGFRCCADPSSG